MVLAIRAKLVLPMSVRAVTIARIQIDSNEPEQTTEKLAAFTHGTVIRKAGSGPYTAKFNVYALPGIGILSISLAHSRVSSPEGRSYVSLTLPRATSLVIREDRKPTVFAPGSLHVLPTDRPFDLRTADPGTTLVANIDAPLIERHLRSPDRGATKRLRLPSSVDVRRGSGASLMRYLEFVLRDVAAEDSAFRSPLVAAEAANLAAALFAHAVDDLAPARRSNGGGAGQREALRGAEEYLAAHLSDPVSLADVAEATGMSVRSLARAFQKHRGKGPIAFLRERRFEAAQRALAAASPDGGSVTQIAMHYGFAHLGRFAQQYHRRFGELPSQTLARSSPERRWVV